MDSIRQGAQGQHGVTTGPSPCATDEVLLAIKRHDLADSFLLFGNLDGQRYTKSRWGNCRAR